MAQAPFDEHRRPFEKMKCFEGTLLSLEMLYNVLFINSYSEDLCFEGEKRSTFLKKKCIPEKDLCFEVDD